MNGPVLALLMLTATAEAQDVYKPPVPIGVLRGGKVRSPEEPIAFPGEDQRWTRVRTPRFEVISSASEARTIEIAHDLEALASVLTDTSTRFQVGTRRPVAFVFSRRKEIQPYFDLLMGMDSQATGLYVRHRAGGTMFIDATRRRFERTAMHELVHDLLRQGDTVPPRWVEEGLAEYFGNVAMTKKALIAGQPIEAHIGLLVRTPTRSLSSLFETKPESPEATSTYFYAQSWAAVAWLMGLDPKAFYGFVQSLEEEATVEQALREHYGKTIDDMRRGMASFDRHPPLVQLKRSSEKPSTEVTVVTRPALLFELGRLFTHVGGAEGEAARYFAEALRLDPKHAPSLAALERFEEAIAAGETDAEIHLLYAESLLGNAVGDFAGIFQPEVEHEERFRRARELAARALTLGGDEARARGAIGVSHLIESDLRTGIEQLERARALAPARMDYALHLFAMYLQRGDRTKADLLYSQVLDRSRDEQIVFGARNIRLRIETDRANALAREGKLVEAAAIIRTIAATVQDGPARAELERHAEQLEKLSIVNRHIVMYNEAVALSNKGRTREAVKLLDELLLGATDGDVVRDAQRLRKSLRPR